MGKVTGFIDIQRKKQPTRDVTERLQDWNEVYLPFPEQHLREQAARCMDCGIPFCHQGCPLGNLIPDWNVTPSSIINSSRRSRTRFSSLNSGMP